MDLAKKGNEPDKATESEDNDCAAKHGASDTLCDLAASKNDTLNRNLGGRHIVYIEKIN